jgi:hypothetical protein
MRSPGKILDSMSRHAKGPLWITGFQAPRIASCSFGFLEEKLEVFLIENAQAASKKVPYRASVSPQTASLPLADDQQGPMG